MMSGFTPQCGAIAVQLGYTTPEKIARCLEIQTQMRDFRQSPRRLGEILVREGHVSPLQLQDILACQGYWNALTSIPGYKILSRIGRGGMGSVYRALQTSLDRIVAIKCLSRRNAADDAFRERFLRESRLAARLNHPNIVQGFDAGISRGVPYFVMEYVQGPNVGQLLGHGKTFVEKEALRIALQVARALEHADARGIVHRDIKPSNILLEHDGTAKLCDLGLAGDPREDSRPVAGTVKGTPSYMSPEQASGELKPDIRSDLYSLGCTVYHLLTGEVPFSGRDSQSVMEKHVHEIPRPPSAVRPGLSSAIDRIILRMMEKEPRRRYPSAAELIRDLENLASRMSPISGAGPEAPPSGPRKRALRLGRIRPRRRPI